MAVVDSSEETGSVEEVEDWGLVVEFVEDADNSEERLKEGAYLKLEVLLKIKLNFFLFFPKIFFVEFIPHLVYFYQHTFNCPESIKNFLN